jgi:uncharacterized membrane-anchored protein
VKRLHVPEVNVRYWTAITLASVFGTNSIYWMTIAVARTTGTAIGDWLADNKALHVGLSLSTLLTCIAFVAVLMLWRRRPSLLGPAAQPAHS